MATLVIGDIHGCYDELLDLVEAAGLGEHDEIISVGDMVDRGPNSKDVLEFFRTRENARSVLGNHERKHLQMLRGVVGPALSQELQMLEFDEVYYQEALRYMGTLPRYIELPEALIVHGFFEPGVALTEQREHVIVGTLRGDRYLRKSYDRPWYELYDYDRPLIVGHLIYNSDGTPLVYKDRVFGLDTGCCHGKRLTGVLLPGFRIISVKSRKDYWLLTRERHFDPLRQGRKDESLSWSRMEEFVAAVDSHPSPVESLRQRAIRIRAYLANADEAAERLWQTIMAKNREVLGRIPGYEEMDQRELGRRYAAEIGRTPLSGLLHRARNNRLTLENLKEYFKTPRKLLEFLEKLD